MGSRDGALALLWLALGVCGMCSGMHIAGTDARAARGCEDPGGIDRGHSNAGLALSTGVCTATENPIEIPVATYISYSDIYILYGWFVSPGHFPVARAPGWRTWHRGPLDRGEGRWIDTPARTRTPPQPTH